MNERTNEWMSEPQVSPRTLHPHRKNTRKYIEGTNLGKSKKWHNFFLRAVGFQSCVPRLCALKQNPKFPYPMKKVCSFLYNYPLKRYTVFPNYLLDVQRTGDMGTSFFTPLWQIECTSLATTAMKENDNFLYSQKKVMSLWRCADPPSQRGNLFKQRPRSHLHPPASTIKHSVAQVFGQSVSKLPRRLPFCMKVKCKSTANNTRVATQTEK